MSKESANYLRVLILDADRNPIKDLPYRIYFNGAVVAAITGNDGLTKKVRTRSPDDEVQIAISRIDGSIKTVARVIAGTENKLVTLISPRIKVVSPTVLQQTGEKGQVPKAKESTPPIYDPKTIKTPTSNKEFGTKVELTKSKDGSPVAKVEGDIPDLNFLDEYNGEEMGEADYSWAAKTLGIEHAAIKAFTIVEAEGDGFLKIGDRTVPKILYERHRFAKFTSNVYSSKNPDISLPCGYYNKKKRYILADEAYKKKRNIPLDLEHYRLISDKDSKEDKEKSILFRDLVKEGKLEHKEHAYYDKVGSYKRLVKAYQLDPEAALQSCSWGSFQIMGEFWKEMGYASIFEFTKSISRSPKEQIKAFVLYIQKINPRIKQFLHVKDWDRVACAYNGPDYKVNEYHIKLRKEYEKLTKAAK